MRHAGPRLLMFATTVSYVYYLLWLLAPLHVERTKMRRESDAKTPVWRLWLRAVPKHPHVRKSDGPGACAVARRDCAGDPQKRTKKDTW